MVSEIPMFSLKMKKMTLKGNERPLILSVLMIAFVLLWGTSGIAWGILVYIVISVITRPQIVK
jgi:CDP-diacylglycerol--serine O-phosphatidyltransferase